MTYPCDSTFKCDYEYIDSNRIDNMESVENKLCDICITLKSRRVTHCNRCDQCHDRKKTLYCTHCEICIDYTSERDVVLHRKRHEAKTNMKRRRNTI